VAVRIPLLTICIATVLAIGVRSSRGDVVVRVEVKESAPKADAKAAAATADTPGALPPADATTVLSVETLAGENGQFATKTTIGKETVELKGDLKKPQDGKYRARVEFHDTSPGNAQEVTTSIMLPAGTPKSIGGFESTVGRRFVVLTLEEAAPAAK
jgi:hypothetical protein